MNYNKVILAGHLTRDPELSHTKKGTALCKFGLAVNHGWGDSKKVLFVDVACFGKRAEILAEHTVKGRALLVEGQLQLEQWEAKDGTKRSRHSVLLDSFEFVGKREDQGGGHEAEPEESAPSESEIPF